MVPENSRQSHMREQAKSPFKKPLAQLGNPTRHLKLAEPITFNFLWSPKQEYMEVDFGSFFAMSIPTLSFRKSEPST
jgi:hypothetical protein